MSVLFVFIKRREQTKQKGFIEMGHSSEIPILNGKC